MPAKRGIDIARECVWNVSFLHVSVYPPGLGGLNSPQTMDLTEHSLTFSVCRGSGVAVRVEGRV